MIVLKKLSITFINYSNLHQQNQTFKSKIDADRPPSNYWIYSKISSQKVLYEAERIFVNTLEYTIDRKNILNIEDITKYNKTSEYIGKIYFSENYVKLMEGLASTMKEASRFLERLNKIDYK
ncbi:MAG: hypothetical protein ACOC35_13980 [Promethearchaeia archaeon]